MPCDHTSQIDNFLIKRKTSGPMDGSLLLNGEFVFGQTEKSIFIKDSSSDDLYQFGRINDTLSVDTDFNWSSEYTKNYIDNATSKTKTILLTAGGINPLNTNGCSLPYVDTDDTVPKVFADFSSGDYGFWNISIPTDYSGSISKVSLIYTSDTTGACSWVVNARILSDGDNIVSGGSWSSDYTLNDTVTTANRLEIIDGTGNITGILGSASNANKFASIRVNLATGTGTFKLLQMKFEYI